MSGPVFQGERHDRVGGQSTLEGENLKGSFRRENRSLLSAYLDFFAMNQSVARFMASGVKGIAEKYRLWYNRIRGVVFIF